MGLPERLELVVRDCPTSARYLGLQGCLPRTARPNSYIYPSWRPLNLHLSILRASL